MHPVVKPTVFFGGTLGVVVLAVSLCVFKISTAIAYRIFEVHATPVAAATDPISRARGAHLARVVMGCTDCHGDNLGGSVVVASRGIGTIAAPNLTRGEGGRTPDWTDLDFVRAVRHGVDPVDRGLWLMPTRAFASVSDKDMAALLAELDAAPPVANSWPAVSTTFAGRFRIALRQMRPLEVTEAPTPTVPTAEPGPTPAYGQYLATIAGCLDCHNEPPALPNAPAHGKLDHDALKHYNAESFTSFMRTGVRPDGTSIPNNVAMRRLRDLSATELAALWEYLKGVS